MTPAQIIPFPFERIHHEQPISKKELAIRWGCSPKTIERKMRFDGLPFSRDASGYARFLLSECEAWRKESA